MTQDQEYGYAAKGDIIAGTGAKAWTKLAVGADDEVLIADSAQASGLKWGAGGGGGATFTYSGAEVFSGASPVAWTDLDLSGTIGAVRAWVFLKIDASGDMNATAVRTNGDGDEFWDNAADADAYGTALGHHTSGVHLVLQAVTDASGVIEWKTETTQTATVDLIMYAVEGGTGVGGDTLWDAKGDLAVGTGADAASRLAVGTDGDRLTADSSQATGLAWQGPIGARVYNSGDITIGNSSWTALTFDSERYDTDTIHSTVANTSRLTATTAGYYLISATARFDFNTTGQRILMIYLNNTTGIARQGIGNADATNREHLNCTTVYYLSASDYVEAQVYQDSGGNLDIEQVGNYSPEFMMQRIA